MVAKHVIESYTNTLLYVLKHTHGKMKRKIVSCPHRLSYLVITHVLLRNLTRDLNSGQMHLQTRVHSRFIVE